MAMLPMTMEQASVNANARALLAHFSTRLDAMPAQDYYAFVRLRDAIDTLDRSRCPACFAPPKDEADKMVGG